jgi:hypothetical protein
MKDHTRAKVELAIRFLSFIALMLVFVGLFYLSFRNK